MLLTMQLNESLSSRHVAYFAVYDGHNGEECSEYLSHELHSAVFSAQDVFFSDPSARINQAFLDTDNNVCVRRVGVDCALRKGRLTGRVCVVVHECSSWRHKSRLMKAANRPNSLARQPSSVSSAHRPQMWYV